MAQAREDNLNEAEHMFTRGERQEARGGENLISKEVQELEQLTCLEMLICQC